MNFSEDPENKGNDIQLMPERHIVLIAPEIHWNTGNIGRTCLGTGAVLHLVKPLGFSISSREVKRAGLDYWHKVKLKIWENFNDFETDMVPGHNEMLFFSKTGRNSVFRMPESHRLFLVFGSETKGLPSDIMEKYRNQLYRIPISDDIRSLNLSTSAGIALYESLRNTGFEKHMLTL